MEYSFSVLKSISDGKPIGYVRSFFDGKFAMQITLTTIKENCAQVFALVFSTDGQEIYRKKFSLNGGTVTIGDIKEKVDLLIVADGEVVAFANLSGVNSKEFYVSRFLMEEIAYDDEAIAVENYYLIEEKYNGKREDCDGKFNSQNDLSYNGGKEQKEEVEKARDGAETENVFNKKQDVTPYYKKVQKNVSGAILRYRSTEKMTKTLPNARFFEIDSKGNRLFGIQYDGSKPSYFIYAVEGMRNEELSIGYLQKFKDKSCFLPESIFKNCDYGYWCVFQDAFTGEIIYRP